MRGNVASCNESYTQPKEIRIFEFAALFKAVVRIYFGCVCPSAQPNVPATSQKISWRQWNIKLRAKILIFFENIWPLQTFTNFLLGDKSLKYFSASNEIGPVTGTARFFGEGCIFGGNIWIWIFPLVVRLYFREYCITLVSWWSYDVILWEN